MFIALVICLFVVLSFKTFGFMVTAIIVLGMTILISAVMLMISSAFETLAETMFNKDNMRIIKGSREELKSFIDKLSDKSKDEVDEEGFTKTK